MKALIPSKSGTSLPDFEEDDYFIVEASWELQNVYEVDQIAAVGFVQDNTSKLIHQAANSSTEQITPIYDNDAAVKTPFQMLLLQTVVARWNLWQQSPTTARKC